MSQELLSNQQQIQTFGDIAITGKDISFTVSQIIQISVAAIQNRPLIKSSPYKGLKRFNLKDKDLFFGRVQLITSLINAIANSNLVLVLGASGSGKSSVVRAGVIPQLCELLGSRFQNFIFTPNRDPFESLHRSLLNPENDYSFSESQAEIALGVKADTLNHVVRTLKPDESQWLFFIDQFEEIFTLCQNWEKRKNFINSIIKIAESKDTSVKVILAMRADFLGQFSPYHKLGKIAQQNIHLVTDMHPDELRLAIEQPAAQHGVVFEEGLVEEIIKDVQGQAGSLPLLQYTLDLLWQTDDITDRTLNKKTYRELGGVRGTLQKHVDQIYSELSEAKKVAAKQIFLRLVDIVGSEESGLARKTVSRRAYQSEFVGEPLKSTLVELINKNLLVSDDTDRNQQPTVEIAHEALLSSWQTLKQWLEDAHQVIAIHNRLAEDAVRWKELLKTNKDRANDELWGGSRLEKALELRKDHTFNSVLGGLSDDEYRFIDVSVTWRDRRRQRTILGLASFSAVALGLSGIAGWQWRSSEQRGQIALGRQLAAQSELVKNQQANLLPRSVLLAVESMRRLPSLETGQILHQDLALIPRQVAHISHEGNVEAIAFSSSGKYLATASWDGTAKIWDVSGGREVARLKPELRSFLFDQKIDSKIKPLINSIAFSPDEKYLATASGQGTQISEVMSGREVRRWKLSKFEFSTYSVAFSPDGKYLAAASGISTDYQKSGITQIWEVSSGREVGRLEHQDQATTVIFSRDGKYLATAGKEKIARVWEVEGGREVAQMKHEDSVDAIAFSPDSKYLATGGKDKTARVWEIVTGQEVARMSHGREVNSVTFNPGKKTKYLATASDDGTARVWEVASGREVMRVEHEEPIEVVVLSPDGSYLATSSRDGTVRLWRPVEGDLIGKEVARIAHEPGVKAIAFSPDGKYLATGGFNFSPLSSTQEVERGHGAWIWEIDSIQKGERILRHDQDVNSVTFSPNGRYLATASGNLNVDPRKPVEEGTAEVWDIPSNKQVKQLKHRSTVVTVAFSPDGKYLATASLDKTTQIWKVDSNQEVMQLKHNNEVLAVTFSPDSKYLITAGGPFGLQLKEDGTPISKTGDGIASLWEVASGLAIKRFQHEQAITSAVFSPDGQYLATASLDKTARLWKVTSGQEIVRLKHDKPVYGVVFSPDGKYLATTSNDLERPVGDVRIWEADSGRAVAQLRHGEAVGCTFSPDGRYLATANWDHSARIWNVGSKQEVLRLAHEDKVVTIDFSRDGKYLATGGYDTYARIWEVATGREVARMKHESVVSSVTFSPDGKQLATASWDNTARVLFFWQPNDLINQACTRLTRNLTPEEWRQYLPNEPYRKTCPNLP